MSVSEPTKYAAERYANYYGDIRRQLSGEFAADVRWMSASLFALNAGGLVTIAGMKIGAEGLFASAVLFWMGILAAFSFVFYSQRKTQAFVKAISGLEEQYVLAAATGEMDVERIAELEAAKRAVKTGLGTPISIASFAMFSAGVAAIGILG